jgi:hypothetical protein
MRRHLRPRQNALVAMLFVLGPSAVACGGPDPEPSPPCEQECQDANALRALRETLKLVFNLTLQGNPVGAQDESTPCPTGGSARVFGQATANAIQGAIEVDLTYEFMDCAYLQRDEDPDENYNMTFAGSVLQQGTIAVQPSVTTALNMSSEALTLFGNVYDPPLEYREEACPVRIGQNGNQVSGTICGREAGVDL